MQNDEPPFIDDLRTALASPSPVALIEGASMLAALQDVAVQRSDGDAGLGPDLDPSAGFDSPFHQNPFNTTAGHSPNQRETSPGVPYPNAFAVLDLAPMFVEADAPETNAVLRVWAEMLGDDMLRRRVRNSVSTREHPTWLDALDRTTVTRAISMGDHFGEEETVLIEAQVDGHPFAMACALQHMGASSLDDAYLLPVSIEVAFGDLPDTVASQTVMRELNPALAKQMVTRAIAASAHFFPPIETDSWPATKPALEWLLRLIPEDANTPAEPAIEFDDAVENAQAAERDRLAEMFYASPEGQALPARVRDEIDLVLEFQHNYGTGDALRWGPVFVEYLMLDLYPRKYAAPDHILLQLPRLLTAVVSWANPLAGVPAASTQNVLKLIKKLTPQYRALVKDSDSEPFPFGAGVLSDPDFLNTLGLSQLMADPGSAPGMDPDLAEMFAAAQHAEYLRAVPPHFREALDRLESPDAEAGEDPALDFLLETFPDSQPDFSPEVLSQFTRSMLERELGGPAELKACDTHPLPTPNVADALALYDIPVDILPRLEGIGDLIVTHSSTLFDDSELVTAALRVLARTASCDPALFRRHSKDENTAAAVCWIAAWLNDWFDSYGESGHTAKALGAAFGMKSSPRTRAEVLIRAMGASIYTRSGDFFLGDARLFTSTQRTILVRARDGLL